jgi:hypothetical protein
VRYQRQDRDPDADYHGPATDHPADLGGRARCGAVEQPRGEQAKQAMALACPPDD